MKMMLSLVSEPSLEFMIVEIRESERDIQDENGCTHSNFVINVGDAGRMNNWTCQGYRRELEWTRPGALIDVTEEGDKCPQRLRHSLCRGSSAQCRKELRMGGSYSLCGRLYCTESARIRVSTGRPGRWRTIYDQYFCFYGTRWRRTSSGFETKEWRNIWIRELEALQKAEPAMVRRGDMRVLHMRKSHAV